MHGWVINMSDDNFIVHGSKISIWFGIRCVLFWGALVVFMSFAFSIILPNIAYAADTKSNPAYRVNWDNEEGFDGSSRTTVISFPNEKEVQADARYRFLMINGVLLPDAAVVIQDDRALVPARIVSETLDAEVKWIAATRQITIDKGDIKIVMTIGSKNVIVNGNKTSLDVPTVLIDDLTYVPLRFVSENLGVNVGYFNEEPFAVFPVIWIDTITDRQPMSEEQAVETAKIIFTTALDEAGKIETEKWLREIIDQLECLRGFSRFWIIGQQKKCLYARR